VHITAVTKTSTNLLHPNLSPDVTLPQREAFTTPQLCRNLPSPPSWFDTHRRTPYLKNRGFIQGCLVSHSRRSRPQIFQPFPYLKIGAFIPIVRVNSYNMTRSSAPNADSALFHSADFKPDCITEFGASVYGVTSFGAKLQVYNLPVKCGFTPPLQPKEIRGQ